MAGGRKERVEGLKREGGGRSVWEVALCVHGHWVRFHSSMSHVLIGKLAPHFVPVLAIVVQWHQRWRCWWWCWIPGCTWGLGRDASHGDMGVGVNTLCRRQVKRKGAA